MSTSLYTTISNESVVSTMLTIVSVTKRLHIVAILHQIHTLLCPLYTQHIASSLMSCVWVCLGQAVMVREHELKAFAHSGGFCGTHSSHSNAQELSKYSWGELVLNHSGVCVCVSE